MEKAVTRHVDERIVAFKRRFLLVIDSLVATLAVAFIVAVLIQGRPNITELIFTFLGLGLAAAAFYLAYRWKVDLAAKAYVFGNFFFIAIPMLVNRACPPTSLYAAAGLLIIAPFLLRPVYALVFGCGFAISVLAANATLFGDLRDPRAAEAVMSTLFLVCEAVVVYFFTREATHNTEALRQGAIENEVRNKKILAVANSLGAAAGEIFAMTQEQTQASMHQSSAVGETRQVLRTVSNASVEIVSAAEQTLKNAEVTVQNALKVSENIRTLSERTQHIFRTLEGIKEVADKSDMLALNAALEGTKAGEIGRGFSLVAGQMQRLAENTAASVRDIQKLTQDIRQATTETQMSMEGATKLANATTEAAHKINLITQQQRSGVEQVSTAMDDIIELTTRVATSTEQTIASTRVLREMSQQLNELVRGLAIDAGQREQ